MKTVSNIISDAFEELGIADPVPDEQQSAKRKLEAMIAQWAAEGARVGYSNGELADDANVPDWAYGALYAGLAIMLAPGLGKTVAMETRALATSGKMAVLSRTCRPVPMKMAGYAGSGSRWQNLPVEPESLWLGNDATLEF